MVFAISSFSGPQFVRTLHLDPYGWPWPAWLIASLSYASPVPMTMMWSMKGKQWQILFSWAPKLLWTETAATKLKETCSLKGKLWQNSACVLSHFSHFWPLLTLWTVTWQAPLSMEILQTRLCTGVGCHLSSWGYSPPRDWTCISYVSCIGRHVLYH